MIEQLSISQYLLESSFCLIVFYIFYHYVLRKETYFQLNRVYLLLTALCSLSIPILNIDLSTTQHISGSEVIVPILTELTSIKASISYSIAKPSHILHISIADVVTWLYVAGLFVMTLKLMTGLFKLFNIISRSPKMKDRGHTLLISEDVPASSFFSYIFWKTKADKDDPIQSAILQHELVHVRQWHSLDIIIMEIMVVIKWFNPLIYLFRNSLRKTHEYIADRYVAQQLDGHSYAKILLTNSTSTAIPFGSSPFYGHIKDRIQMLSQTKSTYASILRYLFIVPITIGLVGLFSFDMTDNLPTPIKTSLHQIESTVQATAYHNVLSLTLDETAESNSMTLLWTDALNLTIDQKFETQDIILNYSRSDLSRLLRENPRMQHGDSEMKVHVDTLEIIRNNKRYAIELSDLSDDKTRNRLLDSLSKTDQLVVGLSAYSKTDSLKINLHLGVDHGANDMWHYTDNKIRHTLKWGQQTIDFADIQFSDGTFLNLDHVVTAPDLELLLSSPIHISVDGNPAKRLSNNYLLTLHLQRASNRQLASLDLGHSAPDAKSDQKDNQEIYLNSKYYGSLYNVSETKSFASLRDFHNKAEDVRSWLATLDNGDVIEVELQVPDGKEQGYKFHLIYKATDHAINAPFPVEQPYVNDHSSRYQLVIREEGKSLIRMDASNPANRDLVEMYGQSDSYQVVDIKDFRSKSRFYTNNLPDGSLTALPIGNRELQGVDVLTLNEYVPEADQLMRMNWGKMISMPNVGNYSMKEFRRSSKVNPKLYAGTDALQLVRFDLLIIPENGKIKRYRTSQLNTRMMREVLANVPAKSSIYFDNIVIDHEGSFYSYPTDFVFTVE